MNKKIIGILVCLLVVLLTLPLMVASSMNVCPPDVSLRRAADNSDFDRVNALCIDPLISSQKVAGIIQVRQEWITFYNSPFNYADMANALTIDADGNVYITGHCQFNNTGGYYDYVTIKYDTNGNQLWAQRWCCTPNLWSEPQAIAVDAQGNVYVTGITCVKYFDGHDCCDYLTIKYDANGTEQWVRRYNGPVDDDDKVHAIAVDVDGNVYVTGYSMVRIQPYHYICTTIKYDRNGTELWVRQLDQEGGGGGLSIGVNGEYIYVGGGTNSDFVVIKYNTSGCEEWVQYYNGPANGFDYVDTLKLDDDSNVYVTGSSDGLNSNSDYTTIKYDTNGTELWVRRYNGPGNGIDWAYDLALDSNANVYVTGMSRGSSTAYDYATIKYNTNGNEKWVQRYNGPGNDWDEAYALDVDGNGNVYVTGYSFGIGTKRDYATVKYDTNGNETWVQRYNGPGNSWDGAEDLAVDADNNVYVTGYVSTGISIDFGIVKYSQYLLGDLNGDWMVNCGDINPFVYALSNTEMEFKVRYPEGHYWAADCNQDGSVDFGDINPFIVLLISGS